jgi:hypothetical protein
MRMPLVLAALAACGGDKEANPALRDTGWFGSETTDLENPDACEETLVSTVPASGDQDWYWHDRPGFFVTTPSATAYEAWIQDADGVRIDTELTWDATGLSATLEWDGWLEASTDYVLVVRDCWHTTEAPFKTSSLGTEMTIEPGDLVGRTYLLDLAGATWVEPPLLGSLISSFFTAPVLLGVAYADVVRIEVVGAPGYIDNFGVIKQDLESPSWDFPFADFSDAPFLDASAPEIELVYNDVCEARVPVKDFLFQGTFSADGTSIGGGVLSGFGDSRYLGCLLSQPDDPAAVCTLASSIGVQCVPCTDGEPYCLFLEAHDLAGVLLPDVHLVEL